MAQLFGILGSVSAPLLTAILAAWNIMGGCHDLWELNLDKEYQEEISTIRVQDLEALEASQPKIPGIATVA